MKPVEVEKKEVKHMPKEGPKHIFMEEEKKPHPEADFRIRDKKEKGEEVKPVGHRELLKENPKKPELKFCEEPKPRNPELKPHEERKTPQKPHPKPEPHIKPEELLKEDINNDNIELLIDLCGTKHELLNILNKINHALLENKEINYEIKYESKPKPKSKMKK